MRPDGAVAAHREGGTGGGALTARRDESGSRGRDGIDYVERAPAAAGVLLLPALYLWASRDEWRMALAAFLLAGLVGLLGAGLYWVAVERRRDRPDVTGWFLAAAGTITVVTGLAAWASGEWLGWRTVLGTTVAGTGIGGWLVFVRIALRGPPTEDAGSEP